MQGSSSRFCPSLSSDWRFVCVAKSQTPWVATEMQRKRYFSRGKRCPQRIFKWFGSLPGDAGTWTWRGTRNVATRDDKDTHSVDRQPRWMTAGWANRNGQSCTIYLWIFLHIPFTILPYEIGYHMVSALLLEATKLATNFRPSYANVLLLYRATKFLISRRTYRTYNIHITGL